MKYFVVRDVEGSKCCTVVKFERPKANRCSFKGDMLAQGDTFSGHGVGIKFAGGDAKTRATCPSNGNKIGVSGGGGGTIIPPPSGLV